jgi:Fe2+ or Zn2+ uptake regulation protein
VETDVESMDSTRALFNMRELRCTTQRVAVYDALRGCKSHPTAEELFRIVRPRVDRLSLATVYNTLEALCGAGLAQKLPMVDGCCRFDADTSDHVHVRIRDTAELADVPSELGDRLLSSVPRQLLAEIADELGVRIDGVNIQLTASREPAGIET